MQKTTVRLPHDLKATVKRAAQLHTVLEAEVIGESIRVVGDPDRGLVVDFTPATNRSPGASTTCSRALVTVIVDTSENWTRILRLHSARRQGPVAAKLDRVAGPTGAGRTTDDLVADQPLSD